MGRQQYNDGQEIVFEDLNKAQARFEKEVYDNVITEIIQRKTDGVFADSFFVNFSAPTSVSINAGVGFQEDLTVLSPEPTKRLLFRDAAVVVNLTPADNTFTRIDLIVMKHARVDGDTENRKFKDAGTLVVSTVPLVVSNEWETILQKVDGTPAGSPVAPAVPAGFIKIAECTVTAVTGMANQAAISDERVLLPVGEDLTVDTAALVTLRITQDSALPIKTITKEVDTLLKDGKTDTNILADSVSDPAAPPNSLERKVYNKGGVLFVRESIPEGGLISPLGSGAGGGAGASWEADSNAPTEAFENSEPIWKFKKGETQELSLFLRVPSGYLAGRQISAFLGAYTPSAANEWKMQLEATLIRKNLDAISSTTNQQNFDTGDITNTVTDQSRELTVSVSDSSGKINSVGISPGDLIKLKLTRIAPGGTEDTADVKFVPNATEFKFS